MSHSIEIIRTPEKRQYSAHIVVDLVGIDINLIRSNVIITSRCIKGFYDIPIIKNKDLRTVYSCGTIDVGQAIGYGKFTGRPVAALHSNKIIIVGRPFNIYLRRPTYILEELREVVLYLSPHNVECAKKKIVEYIVRERKANRISKSIRYLELALKNKDPSTVPTAIVEILEECNVTDEDAISAIGQALNELY